MPGILKAVKAIGWFIPEYGIAQVSVNLTDLSTTSLHHVFDEACRKAEARGIRVTGSELVGLVPLHAMLEAGCHYLRKQKRSSGIPDREIIKIAVKSMGLDELKPFNPDEKIIEYRLSDSSAQNLAGMNLEDFLNITASESPAPGGGSVSALIGALGVALGTMVANLSAHKRGWDHRWEEFSKWAEQGKKLQEMLLSFVDEDTQAFNSVMKALGLPSDTEQEKTTRQKALMEASRKAIEVPFRVMQAASGGFEILKAMAESGNPGSVSDAGVGALALRTCIKGAWLNILINAASFLEKESLSDMLATAGSIAGEAEIKEQEVLAIVMQKINSPK
jgi:glutamate formiminotransferase/formiminotetrahydrofolate cyclodeaminase